MLHLVVVTTNCEKRLRYCNTWVHNFLQFLNFFGTVKVTANKVTATLTANNYYYF